MSDATGSDAAALQQHLLPAKDAKDAGDAATEIALQVKAEANGTKQLTAAPLQKIYFDDLRTAGGLRGRRSSWVPWFILLMCLVQISLHLIADACVQRRFIYMPQLKHEYWRFFTYMLMHSDYLHLGLNVLLQCLIGMVLELEQGHCRLAFIYILGGICGSLVTAWLQPHLSLYGASAGVYAMLWSHLPHLVKNFSQLPHRFVRIGALVMLCLSDASFTAFHFLVNHNRNPRICLEAHVGGSVAGLIFGFVIYRRLPQSPWNRRYGLP